MILSHGLWARRFAADPGVIGRELRMNGRLRTVVGVMPASFDVTADAEALWVPIAFTPERLANHDGHNLAVYGRLKPGVSLEQASAEVAAVMERLARDFPEANSGRSARVERLIDTLVQDHRPRLLVLLGAVGLVLLLACANVANLLLARAAGRQRELAIRAALGAGRGRIARQLLTESALLAAAGGLAGIAAAYGGIQLLLAYGPADVPRLEQARIDGAVLAFAVAATLASGMLFGLAPVLGVGRAALERVLRQAGRTLGSSRDWLRRAVVVGEVALALTLLAGAGLLIRTTVYLQRTDPGFDPSGALSVRLMLPGSGYPEPERVRNTFERAVAEIGRLPGVTHAAMASQVPLGGLASTNLLVIEGRSPDPRDRIDAGFRLVDPGYFRAIGIPLLSGRAFTARDDAGAPRLIIINRALADLAWPGEDPIGRRIACCEDGPDGGPVWKEVVGVVADTRFYGLGDAVRPEFYLPVRQAPAGAWQWLQRSMMVVARTARDPAALAGPVRRALRDVAPAVPVYDVATMEQRLAGSLAEARFNTLLFTLLGAIGLILAMVGVYGVVAYFVGQRTRELGVRMALGATAGDVVRLVVRRGAALTAAGILLGAGAAFGLTRYLGNLLVGVSAKDPATFAAVAAALLAATLAAAYIPARRAAKVDPMVALRAE